MKRHLLCAAFLLLLFLWAQATCGEIYQVKKGDSLYKLAKQFGLSISEIQESNGLTGTGLRVGQILELPEKKGIGNRTPEPKKEQKPNLLGSEDTAGVQIPQDKKVGGETKNAGDTTMVVLKGLLPPERERAGYVLIGDTLKVLKRKPKPASDTSGRLAKVEPGTRTFPPRSTLAQQAVDYALTFLGTPYHYGGVSEEGGFDCSGFVRHVFANFKLDLPHSSKDQYTLGKAVSKDQLEIGDLLFFTRPRRSKGVGHVGIYIGDGQFIHASSGKKNEIIISALDSAYYVKRYVGARRLQL